jgi:hypothetical protein
MKLSDFIVRLQEWEKQFPDALVLNHECYSIKSTSNITGESSTYLSYDVDLYYNKTGYQAMQRGLQNSLGR